MIQGSICARVIKTDSFNGKDGTLYHTVTFADVDEFTSAVVFYDPAKVSPVVSERPQTFKIGWHLVQSGKYTNWRPELIG